MFSFGRLFVFNFRRQASQIVEKKKKKALQTDWREVQIRMRQADKCSSGSHYTAGFVTTRKDWVGKHSSWIIRSLSFAVFYFAGTVSEGEGERFPKVCPEQQSCTGGGSAITSHSRVFWVSCGSHVRYVDDVGILLLSFFVARFHVFCASVLAVWTMLHRLTLAQFITVLTGTLQDAWKYLTHSSSQTASQAALWMTDEQYLFFFLSFFTRISGLTIGLDSVLCGEHDAQDKTFNVSLTEMLGQ